ncbi:hypothetical protein [Polyangium sp. 15x6]|uniref:hypothetical protein n=1 Tax=Polyangium sp. 15x6 TaxID=3042687 RepID=UPI00249A29DB|nr:hypothetical protein [Polyangium sp. 15x6]MDI3285213.1 hypothetical protein [Polyangium sp. 15x6]
MTIARRGSHRLSIDGHELRWWVRRSGLRGCPDCDSLSVVIAAASRKGCAVQVHIPEPYGPDRPITPAFVARIARRALASGWEPGVGSGPFTMPWGSLGDILADHAQSSASSGKADRAV